MLLCGDCNAAEFHLWLNLMFYFFLWPIKADFELITAPPCDFFFFSAKVHIECVCHILHSPAKLIHSTDKQKTSDELPEKCLK